MNEKITRYVFELQSIADRNPNVGANGCKPLPGMFSGYMTVGALFDLTSLLLRIAVADEKINIKEYEFLKQYLKYDGSIYDARIESESYSIQNPSFLEKMPRAFYNAIVIDNELEKIGKLRESYGEKYICIYEAIGKEFIACDNKPTESEEKILNTYIANMRRFYEENYNGSKVATDAAHFEHEVEEMVDAED